MKKLYFSSLLLFGAMAGLHAQQNMTFEPGGQGANYAWNVFENDTNPPLEFVANPNPSGINTSTTVAKFNALATGNPWAGTESGHGQMGTFVLDAAHATLKIMVYKTVISDVAIKLLPPSGVGMTEVKVPNTVTNQWEELTFNLSVAIGQTIDQIVIFPDFSPIPRTYGAISYFDNITFNAGTALPEPAVAAPNPTAAAANVISLFSGAYNNVPVDTWLTVWSASAYQEVNIQGNPTKKYSGLNYAGVETVASQINITGMTHFNLHVWSADFTQFRVKLVDFGADAAYGGGDDTEHELTYETPAQSQWITYHIPIADFVNLQNKQHIAQLIFSSNGSSTVFIDNVYFNNDNVPTMPMVAAPTPTAPSANVISMFSEAYTNVPVDTWLTPWSMASQEEVMIQGNATKKYTNLNFAGIETIASQINATGMSYFNLDVWSPDFTQLRIKLVDFGADAAFAGGDDTEHELTYNTPSQGQWIHYSIPLSSFTNLTNRNHIAQLILASNGTSTVFVDNVYFSTTSTAGVADFAKNTIKMHPNPATEVLNLQSEQIIENVSVYNSLGQEVLHATPNAALATVNVSSLQNGIYLINIQANGAVTAKKFIKQ